MSAQDLETVALLENSATLTPSTLAQFVTRGQWKFFDHLVILEEAFLELIYGDEYDVLLISMPPQHGKSEYLSGWALKYLMGHFPRSRVALISYTSRLAKKWGESARNFFQEWGRELFGMEVSKHKKAADNWVFDSASFEGLDDFMPGEGYGAGSMVTTGTGGGLTGQPVDFGIIDDPIRNMKDAMSPKFIERLHEWYVSVFLSRLSKHAKHAIISTRWVEDDLYGFVLKMAAEAGLRVRVINLPAIALDPAEVPEEEHKHYFPDPLGRQPGEALCPALHPIEQLRAMQKLNEHTFNALYQGDPRPGKGSWVQEMWLRAFHPNEIPLQYDTRNLCYYYPDQYRRFDEVIQSWDTKLSRKRRPTGGSYVAGQVWGRIGARAYLLWEVRERWGIDETIEACRELSRLFPMATTKLFEAKASGPEIVQRLEGEIPGCQLWPVDGDKITRAFAEQHWYKAGNVWLPVRDGCPWDVKGHIREIKGFPTLRYNDRVDAASQALAYFRMMMHSGGGGRRDAKR